MYCGVSLIVASNITDARNAINSMTPQSDYMTYPTNHRIWSITASCSDHHFVIIANHFGPHNNHTTLSIVHQQWSFTIFRFIYLNKMPRGKLTLLISHKLVHLGCVVWTRHCI
jgi:hypothetical protein